MPVAAFAEASAIVASATVVAIAPTTAVVIGQRRCGGG
jgi:hypothetical protein